MNFSESVDTKRAKNLNPIVLAFVGDAVYSLYVREKAALALDAKSGKLSAIAGSVVSARAQARFVDEHPGVFTEDEADIFRRARNAKKPSRAKHSTVTEYNKSTGLEAVFGYLYLIGDTDRLNFLLNLSDDIKGEL
ncbi:MAG: ribonuclease III [Clostridia bacterium]|nr:ribonuclease III [Clostridia bacterium]